MYGCVRVKAPLEAMIDQMGLVEAEAKKITTNSMTEIKKISHLSRLITSRVTQKVIISLFADFPFHRILEHSANPFTCDRSDMG